MTPIFWAFASVIILFVLFLIIRSFIGWRFCVLCASVATTWLVLLIAYWLGSWDNFVLLAILMGGSVVGIYYLLERKLPESLHLFRLPFYLTAAFLVFIALGETWDGAVATLLVVLWLLLGLVYWFRQSPNMKKVAEKIIACCRNW